MKDAIGEYGLIVIAILGGLIFFNFAPAVLSIILNFVNLYAKSIGVNIG